MSETETKFIDNNGREWRRPRNERTRSGAEGGEARREESGRLKAGRTSAAASADLFKP